MTDSRAMIGSVFVPSGADIGAGSGSVSMVGSGLRLGSLAEAGKVEDTKRVVWRHQI